MEYEVVVGLEVHAELSTKSKIYCSCTTQFGGAPNTHTCPICIGMPGVLPVLNKRVVEYAVMAGLAANCNIARFSKQDRKNYFYPDLPKAYQISQFDLPLCSNGYVEIKNQNGINKKIGITRIHIEEDAGKLLHGNNADTSLVDYNRCGVPLIEIVSEPDMRSTEEVRLYLESLKSILEYIGISDCKMQEGSLRADVNVSVRPKGQIKLGIRTELKNLNSFRAIIRGIEYESKRQIEVLENGGVVTQETRRWDDIKGISYVMRSKENLHDYRYFPEPDIPPIVVEQEWIDQIKSGLPELPAQRRNRFVEQYGIPEYDAWMMTSSRPLADFFERAVSKSNNAKAISNWMMGDLMRILREKDLQIDQIPFPPSYIAEMVALVDSGTISGTIAKKVFEIMFETGKAPHDIVKEHGLEVVSDEGALFTIIDKVLDNNQKSISDYKAGKDKAFGFLVGQVMKESRGKGNPQLINKLLKQRLEG